MGEYYLFANLNKREYIDPGKIGFFDEYSSHSHNIKKSSIYSRILNSFCMYLLLYGNRFTHEYLHEDDDSIPTKVVRRRENLKYKGRWAGNPVIYIGDEQDPKDTRGRFFQEYGFKGKGYGTLYNFVENTFTDITEDALSEFIQYSGDHEYRFVKPKYPSPVWDEGSNSYTFGTISLFGTTTMHFPPCDNIGGGGISAGEVEVTEKMLEEGVAKHFLHEAGNFVECDTCFTPYHIRRLRKIANGRCKAVAEFTNNRLDIVERSLVNDNYGMMLLELDPVQELKSLETALMATEQIKNEDDEYALFVASWIK